MTPDGGRHLGSLLLLSLDTGWGKPPSSFIEIGVAYYISSCLALLAHQLCFALIKAVSFASSDLCHSQASQCAVLPPL